MEHMYIFLISYKLNHNFHQTYGLKTNINYLEIWTLMESSLGSAKQYL